MNLDNKLVDAIRDLRYLLSHEYEREGAVRFVANKQRLPLEQRYVLMRAVYSQDEAADREKKIISIGGVSGEIVSIDGYNLLITVESILANRPLILCDDHITRDISAVFGKYKITLRTDRALHMILGILKEHNPKEIHFFYDKQVSKSGELASLTREMIIESGLKGTATTAVKTDIATLRSGGVIVSSDSVVIQKAKRIFDLGGEIAKEMSYRNLIRLPPPLSTEEKTF